ncbi:MAG: DUF502 domain-containing protein [Chitinispirillia bacterium]|jgi:uncharacterized membrane protein
MKKLKTFIRTSLMGGFIVVLPIAILIAALNWIFNFITDLIQPLTGFIVLQADIKETIAHIFVILIILFLCFILGTIVKTKIGKFLYTSINNNLLIKVPGYSLIKETIVQFLGDKKSPFSSVALVNIFGNETMATAFVTDEHTDESYTVFVPTGPNPTSGNIYHLKKEFVHKIDVSVEDTMRSIISCGAGSKKLIIKYSQG